MKHYFTNNESLAHNENIIEFENLKFYTDNGVFSKNKIDYGTRLLLSSIKIDEETSLIDMGCGYGVIGIYLARKYGNLVVLQADINDRAVILASKSIMLNNLKNISAIKSNLFENISGTSDIIVTNPPIRAGKKIVFQLYAKAYEHLNENGKLYIVIRKKQGALSSLKKLEEIYKEVTIINKSAGYMVIRAQK